MKNRINIAELLKDCPKGMELDCPMYENLEFDRIDEDNGVYNIVCRVQTEFGSYNFHTFTKYGCYSTEKYSKCVIFPKGKTTWEGFRRPFKDGDIVFYNDTIAIFKEWGDSSLFRTHCTLYTKVSDPAYQVEIGRPLYGKFIRREIRFATEEEKSKLFQTIKDNGYRWNAETKTLRNLIKPKFKVGDKIRHKVTNKDYIYEISKVYDDSYGLVGFTWMIYMKHQDLYELVPNKFDITTLKPFDKVLVRCGNDGLWEPQFFAKYKPNSKFPFTCTYNSWTQCIPYEGNEHLLETANDCDEYYKVWE